MSIPYEIKPKPGITVDGGTTVFFPVEFQHRARISKVLMLQTVGVKADFTLTLYSRDVSGAESFSGSDPDDLGPIHDDNYLVASPMAGVAGRLIFFAQEAGGGQGYDFVNQDTPRDDRRGTGRNLIYVKLTVAGTGSKEFCLTLGGVLYDGL